MRKFSFHLDVTRVSAMKFLLLERKACSYVLSKKRKESQYNKGSLFQANSGTAIHSEVSLSNIEEIIIGDRV